MNQARPRYQSLIQDSKRWDEFEFRPDDIVITTPPKSGTTWMQQICSLLIFRDPALDRPLASISPWLDMQIKDRDEIFAQLESQRHRRFIKTHTPLDGLPMDDRVTYVCVGRDPRDAAISWDNHMANTDAEVLMNARASVMGNDDLATLLERDPPPTGETQEARFWQWVDKSSPPVHVTSSLWSTLHHLGEALRARDRDNVIVIHYSDLKSDLEGEMRRLAEQLGIRVSEHLWPSLVEAASFEDMRKRADELAPNTTQKLWKENQHFFHSGTGGQWRGFFGGEAQRRYDVRVAELTSPEVAAWAHQLDRIDREEAEEDERDGCDN